MENNSATYMSHSVLQKLIPYQTAVRGGPHALPARTFFTGIIPY